MSKVQYQQAIELLNDALEKAEAIASTEQIQIACEFLAQTYKEMAPHAADRDDAYQKALEYLEKSHELKEKKFEKELDHRLHEMRSQFEIREKEFENKIYRQQIEQQKQELTELTQNLAQRNEIIRTLQGKIQKLKHSTTQILGNRLDVLSAEIDQIRRDEQDWKTFEKRFNLAHKDFTNELASRYPALTRQELKICALIKVGLTTREIAGFLFRSEKSIETHRYNIRKKLMLSPRQDLNRILNNEVSSFEKK